MDTTEIIMIKYIITITLNHHLKPSYCISIVSRMKSVENYPCEVPVNVIPSKPKQDPITSIWPKFAAFAHQDTAGTAFHI